MINKLVRVLGLGLMIASFAFAGFAQTGELTAEQKTALYNKFMENYQSNDTAKIQIALDAAKEYVAKGKLPDDEQLITYFKDAIPTLEASIKKITDDKANGAAIKAENDAWYAQLKKVVDAANAKNWAETFTQGKIAIDTQFKYLDKGGLKSETVKGQKLDIAIALGVIGFDRALEKTETFNDQAVTYLKSSIQQLESGQTGTTTFGKTLGYDLQSKDNALGLLNYYTGFILNYRQKKTDESLAYFYKASQLNSPAKSIPAVYEAIGAKFYDKIAQMDPIRLEKLKALNNVDNDETKAMLAEERGNAERGIEAYSKALKAAQADAKTSQKYKDDLRATLEQLYKFRMNLKEGEKVEGLDAQINAAAAKPLTNPAEPVKPIVIEEPAPTTETTPAATTSTTTTPGAKPAATTVTTPATKPAATTTTPATTKPATTATKPAAATTVTKPATTATKPATTTTTKTTTPKKPRRR